MIVGTTVGMTMQVEGLAGVQQRIEARLREQVGQDTEIAIVAGGVRGGAKNAMIARVQAAMGRNLAYAGSKTMQLIRAAVPGLLRPGTHGPTAQAIGNMLIIGINENVGAQKNPDGSTFKALTPGYARRKQAKWGFVRPIMRASGDLLGGLRVRVTRGGRG